MQPNLEPDPITPEQARELLQAAQKQFQERAAELRALLGDISHLQQELTDLTQALFQQGSLVHHPQNEWFGIVEETYLNFVTVLYTSGSVSDGTLSLKSTFLPALELHNVTSDNEIEDVHNFYALVALPYFDQKGIPVTRQRRALLTSNRLSRQVIEQHQLNFEQYQQGLGQHRSVHRYRLRFNFDLPGYRVMAERDVPAKSIAQAKLALKYLLLTEVRTLQAERRMAHLNVHGVAVQTVPCPNCRGSHCPNCNGAGVVPEAYHPSDAVVITPLEVVDDIGLQVYRQALSSFPGLPEGFRELFGQVFADAGFDVEGPVSVQHHHLVVVDAVSIQLDFTPPLGVLVVHPPEDEVRVAVFTREGLTVLGGLGGLYACFAHETATDLVARFALHFGLSGDQSSFIR